MGNERKLRLIQVAKEFNVGINTITDFLHKKGIKSDGSPNTQVDADTYAILEKEFGANRAASGARDSIRERISLKQTTVTIEGGKKPQEEEKEVVIKSNVINVRDEIQQPKFLGKIDLDPKPKAAKTAAQPAVLLNCVNLTSDFILIILLNSVSTSHVCFRTIVRKLIQSSFNNIAFIIRYGLIIFPAFAIVSTILYIFVTEPTASLSFIP